MAQALFNGPGALWPASGYLNTNTLGTSQIQMDAATEMGALVGPVYWPEDGDTTKQLTHVHWRSGSPVVGGSSQWRLSIQGISTAASPMQPNGTPAEHYTPAVGVSPVVNGWNRDALNTARTVTRGDLLAFVWEWLTFNSGDVLRVAGGFSSSTLFRPLQTDMVFYTGAAWTSVGATVDIVLEFSDGTFGTLYGSHPFSASAITAFNADSTGGTGLLAGDERGLEFTTDVPLPIEGFWGEVSLAGNSSDFDIVLYEGTTAAVTLSVDATQVAVTGGNRRFMLPLSAIYTILPGLTYRLMIKPTTANNVSLQNFTLDAAAHRILHGGLNVAGVSREDGGAFSSPAPTQIPLLGLVLAGADDGTGPDISGTHTISGTVSLDDAGTVPAVGATVRCIRQSDNGMLVTTTNASGQYSFSVASGGLYHVTVEYIDGGQRRHWRSLFDLTPVAP